MMSSRLLESSTWQYIKGLELAYCTYLPKVSWVKYFTYFKEVNTLSSYLSSRNATAEVHGIK